MNLQVTIGKLKIAFSLLFCLVLNPFFNFGQGRKLSEGAEISVLTCDVGNEMHTLYGHTAIRVKDPAYLMDEVFNYGYFDFSTPNFLLKFTKGNLKYFVATDRFENFSPEYVYNQRGVYEQKLNLSQAQKQAIFDDLLKVLSSDERFYTYKFIDRNCTSMVADLLNKHLDGKISIKVSDSNKTYRVILYGYLDKHFYEKLGINIMFGLKTDKVFNHIYLPLQLMEGIKLSKNNGQKLSDSVNVINIESAPEVPVSLWNNCYTYLVVLLLVVLINKKSIYLTYFILMGCLGIFLFSMGFISLHNELSMNYNILLFNPLLLLLVYSVLSNKRGFTLKASYVILGILGIYVFMMLNKVHFLLFLPMIITNAFLVGRLIVRTKKELAGS